MTDKTVQLLPSEIVCDEDWNSRKSQTPTVDSESPDQLLSQAQLDVSIAKHGVLQFPCVRRKGAQWALVYGFRRVASATRVAPDSPITCKVLASLGDEARDERRAREVNLVENLHREALKPWEIAESLYHLKQCAENPRHASKEIAAATGLSVQYVRNLIRFRTKAHPKLWEQFKRWGMSMSVGYRGAVTIIALPLDRQLDAGNALLKERKGPARKKRGKEKKPGPAKLLKIYNAVDGLKSRPAQFRKGLKLGLAIALGKKQWLDEPHIRQSEPSAEEQQEHHGNKKED